MQTRKRRLQRGTVPLSDDSSTESIESISDNENDNINVLENSVAETIVMENDDNEIDGQSHSSVVLEPSEAFTEFIEDECQRQGLQKPPPLKCSLAAWAVSCRVPQSTLRILLRIMQNRGLNVPLDPRTLLKTPRNTDIINLSYGDYQHYGIQKGIIKVLDNTHPSVLNLAINIDDVPINRIVSITVITGCLENSTQVFLIGAFQPNRYESKKLRILKQKCDQNEFLIFVVDELIDLFYEGFDYDGKHYNVMLDFLCSDAPAKSKVLKSKGHTGFSSCTKCKVEGASQNRRTFFNNLKAPRRTDDEEFLKSKAVWKNIPQYRLVTDTVLDYMHLVILGVTKRLLLFWTEGEKSQKLGRNVTTAISEALSLVKKYRPVDFVRRCDDLEFVSQWKATQYRQFLLYQGIFVLRNKVPENVYKMFLHLSLGIRILCSNQKDLYSKGNKLLKTFIKMFIDIYGQEYCNHNVHGLSHLYEDVLNHGPLDRFSAFRFENFMQLVKHDVRKPGSILTQLSNRIIERENVSKEYCNSDIGFNRLKKGDKIPPLGSESPEYSKYEHNGLKIDTTKLSDTYFGTTSKDVIKIENIATKFGRTVLIGRKFLKKQSFFKSPMDSADLDIYKVADLSNLRIFSLDDLEQKFFCMPMKRQFFLVVPLIHSDSSEYSN